jgi:hypothetical protein
LAVVVAVVTLAELVETAGLVAELTETVLLIMDLELMGKGIVADKGFRALGPVVEVVGRLL